MLRYNNSDKMDSCMNNRFFTSLEDTTDKDHTFLLFICQPEICFSSETKANLPFIS